MHRSKRVLALAMACALALVFAGSALAQGNAADLSGTVTDPQGLAVKGAKVTVASLSTGAERSATANENGYYSLLGLPPGKYKLTIDGGSNFQTFVDPELTLTIGSAPIVNIQLQIRGVQQSVTVTGESVAIETTKTEVSQTVEQRRIENLPINGRNYINFTLTNSQTVRDSAPSIGAAPTSGLNMGGQRARSNEVMVDGADAVDNSVNGIRATVSQEAVQEFQMILSNYNAEYGRAMGGVINIVSKGGSNDFHGSLFGYLRNKSIQARNAFSVEVDPATGALDPIKQAYTRVQAGFTLGGAIKKDKTFYFLSLESTRRQETGFTSIGASNFGLAPYNCGGCGLDGLLLTADQGSTVTALLQNAAYLAGLGSPAAASYQDAAVQYAALMGSGSSVALYGVDPGAICGSYGLCSGMGARFPLPVDCPGSGTIYTIGTLTCVGPAGVGMASLPAAFVPLNSLRGNFPMKENTDMWSARLDHRWNNANNSFLRVGVSPSFVNGIQVNAQNQNMGQNAASRTSLQQSRDFSAVYQHDTIFHSNNVNVFRFQFARRGLHYGYSQAPGGSGPGVNIAGFAYFGREPFSTVDRIERRYQFTDSLAMTRGSHTFKVGADFNLIQLDSAKDQIFELNFGSVINFGALSASTFGFPSSMPNFVSGGNIVLPGATGVQTYGLGLPTTFIQGIGNSKRPFNVKTMGFYVQDSWRINRKLTMNYGVRYDLELMPLFTPATALNVAAENALKVVEGIPTDKNNVSPRLGLAWDPAGNGKTVVRAGYGIFFDHPLLAVAFNSVTAEGAMSSQLLSGGGVPSACNLLPTLPNGCGGGLDTPTNLNAASIFQGVLNAIPSMGYLPQEQRFNPYQANSLFTNQNFITAGFPVPILPFPLPVAANFQYGYAQQGNLTIERELANNWKFSIGYQYTHGLKLNRPRDINSTDPVRLTNNFRNALLAGMAVTNPLTMAAPAANIGSTATTCGVAVIIPQVVGMLNNCPIAAFNGQMVATPAFFNFFRPSGPNPSFAGLIPTIPAGAIPLPCFSSGIPSGYAGEVAIANCSGLPTGFGVPVAFNSVDNQESSGNSVYHGLTATVTKRFSKGFEMLSSYTWSHAIDDSTDLQTLLEPQDGRFPNIERGNSSFDQRHRWVTSAVFQAGSAKSGDSFLKHLIADTSLSPIIEYASGRPFTVLTGTDFRLNLGASQGRPSLGTGAPTDVSSPYLPGVSFSAPSTCLANDGTPFADAIAPYGCIGNLGRNKFVRPNFFQFDLRLARRFPVGEKLKLDVMADAFNIVNRMNVADVSPLCNPLGGCTAGQPTAALDARQFQFALKLSW